jgi:hypothetical protein
MKDDHCFEANEVPAACRLPTMTTDRTSNCDASEDRVQAPRATKPLRPIAVATAAILTPFWAIIGLLEFPLIIGPDAYRAHAADEELASVAAFALVPVSVVSALFAATIATDPRKRFPLAFILLTWIAVAAACLVRSVGGELLALCMLAVAANAAVVVQGVFPDN